MACYNSSEYLDEAISSVRGQTLRDLELIVIDDCSSDDTLEIARRHAAADGRVVVISLPVNSGPAAARNAGIRAACGKWLGILDSDDVAIATRFEEQLALAESGNDVVMIGAGFISMDSRGEMIKQHSYPTNHRALVRRLHALQPFLPHSSMIYRRDAVARVRGFNARFVQSEDYDLWLRLSEVGRLGALTKPLVKCRKHGKNISNIDGGDLQTRYGIVAVTCHFLRRHGFTDPSTSDDVTAWREFMKWLDERLLEERAYERSRAWIDARAEFFGTEHRLAGAVKSGVRLLRSGHVTSLVAHRLFGSSLPKLLARQWMTRSCAAS